MGFSTFLQGKAAHEALLSRQDAELRLLETMRRCIASKLKSDRDYAFALSSLSSQGQKPDRSEDLSGSLVAQAWRGIMEELDGVAKLIRNNAEVVEKETLEKLNTLCQEKRKARKQYLEEHNRITHQFTNVSEEVTRKKADYQKQLEFYRLMRSRFEEYYIKSGRGGRKLDEVRDKYQRACRRLHLIHNEYVLLLAEAEQMQRDLRTCLLPTLLHQHQATLQAFILNWRSIMKEIASNWNFTTRQFREVFTRSEALVDTVVPSDEYTDFLQRQKTSPPESTDFSFDNSLVEDTSGKLLANKLAVDNLTVEWVRGKLSETEPKFKECQEKLSNKNAHLQEMSEVELAELQCEEKKLAKQLEVIKKALTELGCEEVPSGCDIPIETNYDHSHDQV